jgi:hypothetical protein
MPPRSFTPPILPLTASGASHGPLMDQSMVDLEASGRVSAGSGRRARTAKGGDKCPRELTNGLGSRLNKQIVIIEIWLGRLIGTAHGITPGVGGCFASEAGPGRSGTRVSRLDEPQRTRVLTWHQSSLPPRS